MSADLDDSVMGFAAERAQNVLQFDEQRLRAAKARGMEYVAEALSATYRA